MRYCKKCQAETARNSGGECKPCIKIYRVNYYSANSEKLKKHSRDYYATNKENVSATNAAWVKANPDKVKACQAKYRSSNPDKEKCRHKIYRITNKEKIDVSNAAYRAANTEKIKVSRLTWCAANPEKKKANRAAWEKANPEAMRVSNQNRRARERGNGGKLSKGLFDKLFKLQRGKCPVCKVALSNVKPRSPLDHVTSLASGGRNEDWNMQILCQPCNGSKHAKDPIAFMQSRGYLL